ncbi:MAG: ABC transporter permease [Anaerolineales bacterium]|nr:ABC transporter permease [Anaerolineales bacterium]
MLSYTGDLYEARDLLWAWTSRNIRARYQQSSLGWLWAVIQPAAQVTIFSLIFTLFVPVDTGNIPYPVFSFVAVVPWTLLSASIIEMSQSLVVNMGLVTKIYFPREILPIAAMLARLMDFGVSVGLLIILMLFYQVSLVPASLLFLPLILVIQLTLILGLGLASAAGNVFFRDVQSLLALTLQVWFYASPIIYPVTMVPEYLRPYYYLNPMAGVIEAYRDVLLNGQVPGTYLIPAAAVSLVVFLIGYWFFKRVEFQFADIV